MTAIEVGVAPTQDNYELRVDNSGRMNGGVSVAIEPDSAVPEPATLALVFVASVSSLVRTGRTANKLQKLDR